MPDGNKKSRREKKAPGLPLSPAYAATDLPDTAGLPLVSSSVRGNECSNCFELFFPGNEDVRASSPPRDVQDYIGGSG